jgi:hypothetical protein
VVKGLAEHDRRTGTAFVARYMGAFHRSMR